eukprot:jgi/Bigna1/79002/fgenesh1_pg.59_\
MKDLCYGILFFLVLKIALAQPEGRALNITARKFHAHRHSLHSQRNNAQGLEEGTSAVAVNSSRPNFIKDSQKLIKESRKLTIRNLVTPLVKQATAEEVVRFWYLFFGLFFTTMIFLALDMTLHPDLIIEKNTEGLGERAKCENSHPLWQRMHAARLFSATF